MPRNWDEFFSDPANQDHPPEPLLVQLTDLVPPGRALDLACGAGHNSLYLAKLAWQVTAVDFSAVAIRLLRQRAAGLAIDIRLADLERGEFKIEPERFDLICDFFYLQRSLFPQIREGVRPGGIFVGAIHIKQSARPASFVLEPGELRRKFQHWTILFYSEEQAPGGIRPSARIIARK